MPQPSTLNCDVLVLGGGPAGCSTALMLLLQWPELRVVLAEADTGTVVRPGEAMHAKALPLLRQLGIDKAFLSQDYLQSQGMRVYWGTDEVHERHQLFDLAGAGWQLDRSEFHRFLRQCFVERGGTVLEGKFMGNAQKTTQGWQVELSNNHGKFEIHCPLVADATGRKAVFARHCGAQVVHTDHLCGVQRFFQLSDGHPMDHFVQIESVPDGWWYSAPLPDHRCAVTLFTDSDLVRSEQWHLPQKWDSALEQATKTSHRVANATEHSEVHVFNAMSQYLTQAIGSDWLAVGDAANAFDPLSGQGIIKALKSGIWAAFAAKDLLDGRTEAIAKYQRVMDADFAGYKAAFASNYTTEGRWRERTFWNRRA